MDSCWLPGAASWRGHRWPCPCLVCMADLYIKWGEGMQWNPGIQTAGDWKAARMKWEQDENDQGKKVLHYKKKKNK